MPYTLSGFTSGEQATIRSAMDGIEDLSGVRFVNRSGESDYVDLYKGNDGECFSQVGRRGGKQGLSLGNNCVSSSVIQHELLHALGFWHEQSREDRNNYVTIWTANIESGKSHNFDQHISDGDDVGSYDYMSIMHYGRTYFSKNGQPTITRKNDYYGDLHGYVLSDTDIETLRSMYGFYSASGLTLDVRAEMCYGANEASWNAMPGASYYKLVSDAGYTYATTTNTWTRVNVNRGSSLQLAVKWCDAADNCSGPSNYDGARYVSGCY